MLTDLRMLRNGGLAGNSFRHDESERATGISPWSHFVLQTGNRPGILRKNFGPGFGHGSVPVLATITGMPPSQLVTMALQLSVCSVSGKYPSALFDRCQSLRRFLRLWSWLPRFDS